MQNNVICVIGTPFNKAHHLTRLLNIAGLYIGELNELVVGAPDNARNISDDYCNLEVMRINKEILRYYTNTNTEISWNKLPTLPDNWQYWSGLNDLYRQAEIVISSFNKRALTWGFYDTRLVLTLPFWQRLLPHLIHIICLNNYLELIATLDNLPTKTFEEETFLTSANLLAQTLKNTSNHARFFINDELDSSNWQYSFEILFQSLTIDQLAFNTPEKHRQALLYILKHYCQSPKDNQRTNQSVSLANEQDINFAFQAILIKKLEQRKQDPIDLTLTNHDHQNQNISNISTSDERSTNEIPRNETDTTTAIIEQRNTEAQLLASNTILQHVKSELDSYKFENFIKTDEIRTLHALVKHQKNQNQNLVREIQLMEHSKFWRLRFWYLRFKFGFCHPVRLIKKYTK